MAATFTPPRTRNRTPLAARARTAFGAAVTRSATVVSAVRHRHRSPALTIAGLGCIDGAAWTTFGWGATWLAVGVSLLLYDWSRDDQ